MPLTFPSHAAAVLPLKLWRPVRLDGVALVIGSTTPDLPYSLSPWVIVDTHAWSALLWFCVPVTLAGAIVIRRSAPTIAAHLPDLGDWHLRDYGAVGLHRYPVVTTVLCAGVGAATHLVWDSFTHRGFESLNTIAFDGQPWWHILQIVSTLLGAAATVAMAWVIGRRRLLLDRGPAPAVEPKFRRFWCVAAVIWAVGLAAMPFLPDRNLTNVLGVRLLFVFALGLLLAATATATVVHMHPLCPQFRGSSVASMRTWPAHSGRGVRPGRGH